MVRALFFDLDETLVERHASFVRWAQALACQFPHVAVARLLELDARGHVDRLDFCQAVIDEFVLGRSARDLATELLDHMARSTEVSAGVVGLLEELAPRFAILVVTNGGSRTQRAKLERAGILRHVTRVLISEEIGAEKPSPVIFERALRWAGCTAAEAMFIGDDPDRDIVGAAAVGLHTAWLGKGRPWPGHLPPPDHVLHDLRELRGCLR